MNINSQNRQTPGASVKKNSFLSSNPVMRRLNSVEEYSEDNASTYRGITLKTVFFLLFSVVGIAVQLILSPQLAAGDIIRLNYKGFGVELFTGEAIALAVAVIAAIVFQLLAFFVKPSVPVTGALYCITQGYIISFIIFKVLKGLEYLGALALMITLLIIVIMSILYSTGIIRVTKKFKMVMITLFATVIAGSLLTFIGTLIPFTREMALTVTNNLFFSLISSVIFIIIAALFLICDFDTIDHVVSAGLPKKYEWHAAFGLAFTVIWLYLKVLDIIVTIAGRNKS